MIYFRKLIVVLTILSMTMNIFAQSAKDYNWHKMYKETEQGSNSTEALNLLRQLNNKKRQKEVIVAIIDSGIDTTSIDLKSALWVNPKEKRDGKDNDKNGYIDDIHGWNFLGTPDGSFNMTSAGTEEYREFKRLYAKYKNKQDKLEVDQDEYSYYLEMKKKAGIANYIKFFEFNLIKNQSYQYIDSLLSHTNSIDKDTVTVGGFSYLSFNSEEWVEACQTIFADLYKNKKTTTWDSIYNKHQQELQLMIKRIEGIEKDKDKRLLIGDDLSNPKDRFYGNPNLHIDGNEHGTFVASIIAGQGVVEPNISGIFPEAKLMIIRAVPDGDEYDKDIASAIHYAVDNGAKVINMSLGKYTSPQADMVNEAIAYAAKHDVLIVQAAGNNGKDLDKIAYYPSAINAKGEIYNNYIRVGASDLNGKACLFSNFGKTKVDVFAPGDKITATATNNEIMTSQGTSLSAPIISGIAAMLRSYFPKLKAHQIKEILMKSVRPMEQADLSVSGGIVDAINAVNIAIGYKK